ncbi:MAG: hypothetical protein OXR62_04855 [Ahrensia sp.]|nr:hypothetical protein [Ahrensia sp.]
MEKLDWTRFFARAGAVTSHSDANRLLAELCGLIGFNHYRFDGALCALAGSVEAASHRPLSHRVSAFLDQAMCAADAHLLSHALRSNSAVTVDDLSAYGHAPAHVGVMTVCPVRFASSGKAFGMFVGPSQVVHPSVVVCLQSAVVKLCEVLEAIRIKRNSDETPLSDREAICLDMYSRGFDVMAIATMIDLTEQATAAVMQVAKTRLRAKTLAHAVAIAIREELI